MILINSYRPQSSIINERLWNILIVDISGDLQKRKRKYTPEDRVELGYEPETKYSAVQLDNELGSKALNLIEAVLNLKNEKDEAKVVEAIKTHKLVREHVPTDMLNSVAVWHALLEKMPMTALIR